MWITSSLKAAKTPVNIALGNFDGVHLGHQRVMAGILPSRPIAASPALSSASIAALHQGVIASGYSHLSDHEPLVATDLLIDPSIDSTDSAAPVESKDLDPKIYATVVTFLPHPQDYFSGISRPLLTPIAEKIWQLAQLGIDQLVMLPFNRALAELGPEAFVKQILIEGLQVQQISVGDDFRFGKGRGGDAKALQMIAATCGVPVIRVPLLHEKGDRISSSRIRQALQIGNLSEATQLLGRPYTLTGRVVQGQQIGRTIGFPTANLQIPPDKYLPRTGVYSVQVYGASTEPVAGVMNIGHRPTVKGQSLSVEVYLLNWAGDLYGNLLTVSLIEFVRPEQTFDSLESLKAQITADCERAIATLTCIKSSRRA